METAKEKGLETFPRLGVEIRGRLHQKAAKHYLSPIEHSFVYISTVLARFSPRFCSFCIQIWHHKREVEFVRLALQLNGVSMIPQPAFACYNCAKKAIQQSKLGRKQGYPNELNVDLHQQGHDDQSQLGLEGRTR